VEWRYNSTHSLTSALDGGSGQLHAPATLPPRKDPLVPTGYEVVLREKWTRNKRGKERIIERKQTEKSEEMK
jgi:hypothetical protein